MLDVWIQQWANTISANNPNGTRPAAASFGAYVDLYYARGINVPAVIAAQLPFAGPGDPRSGLHVDPANPITPATYDTWTTFYESDGVNQDFFLGDQVTDEGTDGIDNLMDANGSRYVHVNNPGNPTMYGGVDDASEFETAPPYDAPLKSIQIKIRVFEPGSRQIREVTIVQDFVS
jgi:hypothetical protein